MNKVMPITYYRATMYLPFICRMLLQTISEDICFHITTYLPRCDSTKLLAAYVLYNGLKFDQLFYINPSLIHLLRREKKSSHTVIIHIRRVVVPSAPESRCKLSSHRKHFSTKTKHSQKKSKKRINKLWTKSRQYGRNVKYSDQNVLNIDDDRPLSSPDLDYDYLNYGFDYPDSDCYDSDSYGYDYGYY
jgi:hypothetical protein